MISFPSSKATKMVRSLGHTIHKEGLRIGFIQPREWLIGDLTAFLNYLRGYMEGKTRLLYRCKLEGWEATGTSCNRGKRFHRESGQKLKQGAREAVDHPSLQILKIQLDSAMSNLM